MRLAKSVCALIVAGGFAASASAASIQIQSDGSVSEEGLGSFTGEVDYNSVTQKFTVSLTNTSPLANGGFLTAFAFNIAGDATAALSPSPQHNFEDTGNVAASPFGSFEAGAGLGGAFNGGGSPNGGIAVGQTRSFEFMVTGNDASILTTVDFLTELTAGQGGNGKTFAFAARFRGFADGGSDKVPGTTTQIPTPAAAGAGLMLLGMLVARRQRR